MILLALAALGIIGAAVGSFLSVVIRRTATGASVVWGRSRCPACKKALGWSELLPLISFVLQRGRCRSCRRRISMFYPAVELITAGLFVGLGAAVMADVLPPPPFALNAGLGMAQALDVSRFRVGWFLYYAFFAATGVAVSFYDAAHRLIPSSLIRPLVILGVSANAARLIKSGEVASVLPALAVAGSAFLLFWALWFFSSGRAMGRGDADVALALGVVLPPSVSAPGFLFAVWLGAGFGLVQMARRRAGWSSRIPFAPFLFAGALAALGLALPLSGLNPFFSYAR